MRYAGACYGRALCHRLLLHTRPKQRIHLACDTDYSRECLLSRGGRWRTGWQRHNDSRTLRHSPGPVFQRVGTGFGSHRGSRSTDSQPGEAGTGVIERHFLGHGDNLRPHRTGHREQHTGLSRDRLQERGCADSRRLQQDSRHRGTAAVVRTAHFRLHNHSGMELLRGESHRIPRERKAGKPHSIHPRGTESRKVCRHQQKHHSTITTSPSSSTEYSTP